MISCVTLRTAHLFRGNPIASMFELRYRAVIERQEWEVPHWRQMEYDEFDNPATSYFLWRDADDVVRGCARLNPTDRPYMLKKAFSFLVTDGLLPENDMAIWEGSRICVDKDLPALLRKRIIFELSVAYMEFALANGIQKIIGVMLPAYWRSVYIASGWDPFWYGGVTQLPTGERVRAGGLPVFEEIARKVRRTTGIHETILSYGDDNVNTQRRVA
ncbi:MAG: acyl-homoserine-lactone synthase [Bryobacteraceae bacterium]